MAGLVGTVVGPAGIGLAAAGDGAAGDGDGGGGGDGGAGLTGDYGAACVLGTS